MLIKIKFVKISSMLWNNYDKIQSVVKKLVKASRLNEFLLRYFFPFISKYPIYIFMSRKNEKTKR